MASRTAIIYAAVAGISIGMAIGSLIASRVHAAEPEKGLPLLGVDPSDNARIVKLSQDGYVICVPPWPTNDAFGVIHRPAR